MRGLLLIGLALGIMAAGCTNSKTQDGYRSESEQIFSSKIGQYEVYMLVEAERDGNTAILVGADEAVLERYIPETGFKHTANAVFVKSANQNVLIDSGTGAGGIIVEKLKKLGIEGKDVNSVLITHLHGDHFGGLARDGEANFPNAQIYVSVNDLEYFTVTNPNQGAVNTLTLYEGSITTFEPAELGGTLTELLPGISPIAAYGHTPGHTLFQIEDKGQKLLVIGDLLHLALVQFAIPEISATFDVDPAEAAITRRQVLAYAAENKIPIIGMHIVYPGTGTVEVEDSGFKFIPAK